MLSGQHVCGLWCVEMFITCCCWIVLQFAEEFRGERCDEDCSAGSPQRTTVFHPGLRERGGGEGEGIF